MENLFTHTDNASNAALLIGIGLLIRFIIGYRRFNRRGVAGLQQFDSYWKAILITTLEWVFKWTANALILFGIMNMIISI
ncbi:MAG: hypothetical protein WC716_11765 [Chitinophagaceae bacterium]|jgi:hypothetical protein